MANQEAWFKPSHRRIRTLEPWCDRPIRSLESWHGRPIRKLDSWHGQPIRRLQITLTETTFPVIYTVKQVHQGLPLQTLLSRLGLCTSLIFSIVSEKNPKTVNKTSSYFNPFIWAPHLILLGVGCPSGVGRFPTVAPRRAFKFFKSQNGGDLWGNGKFREGNMNCYELEDLWRKAQA